MTSRYSIRIARGRLIAVFGCVEIATESLADAKMLASAPMLNRRGLEQGVLK